MVLSGNRAREGHVEIFLPAGKRAVGTAEPEKGELAFMRKRHGGELRLALGVEQAQVVADDDIAESGAGCKGNEQVFRALWHKPDKHAIEAFSP